MMKLLCFSSVKISQLSEIFPWSVGKSSSSADAALLVLERSTATFQSLQCNNSLSAQIIVKAKSLVRCENNLVVMYGNFLCAYPRHRTF